MSKNGNEKDDSDRTLERLKLYYGSNNSLMDQSLSYHRVLGQITRIYELHLKITCRKCSRLWNACQCGRQQMHEDMRVDLSTIIGVDDHTSIVKLAYSTSNFEARFANQSNLFGRMGESLVRMLSKHLAEINMPCVPIQNSIESRSNTI